MATDTTSKTPRVGLAAFADYLSASPGGRLDRVRRQIATYAGPYRPGAAFYKDFVDAVISGRRTDTDELTLRRCVADQRVPARAKHYEELGRHWMRMRQWHLPITSVGRASWELENLTVGLKPELALERSDGAIVVCKLWPYADAPTADAIRAVHWLLARHMPRLRADGVPALIDLRREKVHLQSKRPFRKGFDTLLANEANSMGLLWTRLADIP